MSVVLFRKDKAEHRQFNGHTVLPLIGFYDDCAFVFPRRRIPRQNKGNERDSVRAFRHNRAVFTAKGGGKRNEYIENLPLRAVRTAFLADAYAFFPEKFRLRRKFCAVGEKFR